MSALLRQLSAYQAILYRKMMSIQRVYPSSVDIRPGSKYTFCVLKFRNCKWQVKRNCKISDQNIFAFVTEVMLKYQVSITETKTNVLLSPNKSHPLLSTTNPLDPQKWPQVVTQNATFPDDILHNVNIYASSHHSWTAYENLKNKI